MIVAPVMAGALQQRVGTAAVYFLFGGRGAHVRRIPQGSRPARRSRSTRPADCLGLPVSLGPAALRGARSIAGQQGFVPGDDDFTASTDEPSARRPAMDEATSFLIERNFHPGPGAGPANERRGRFPPF